MNVVETVEGLEPLDAARAVERGYTLPASWYSDPAVHALERERIFRRSWQYAGPAAWVTEPGDHFACRAGHVPLVVVRDEDGTLAAHVNVCRHRGHLVVRGRGNRRSLQCPYHAWTYALDGSLRTVPRAEREPCFEAGGLGLLPARADIWGPFVFVNPDPAAEPLAERLGELPDQIAEAGLDLDAVRFHSRLDWELGVNWKLAIENDLECYHCPVAHPSLSDIIDVDPGAYGLEVHETFTSQLGPLREEPRGGASPYDTHGEVVRTQAHLLWPNVSININAGRPNVGMHVWRPDGVARIAGVSDYYFGADVDEAWIADMVAFDREVGAEDNALVASVQEGFASGMLERGRLLPESERLVQHFQLLVARALAGGDGPAPLGPG